MRMRKSIRILILAGLALPVALGACKSSSGGGPTDPPGPSEAVLTGQVAGTRTLSRDTVYTIVGYIEIQAGAQLVVPSGTTLLSDLATRGSIVTQRCTASLPSGKLVVQGTASAPVIFRPATTAARTRGQAGGIVLHGCAPINQPVAVSEGVNQAYGGTNPNDSSGEIRYLRIEFGGVKVTPDNEINGLTMAGVGNGTIIEHVQAHFIADDGFEWFGGTVNAKWLLSTGNDDDNLDCDFGWNGTVQFFVAIQDRNLANRGAECDNDANSSANTPQTSPTVWNATFIGAGVERANSETNDGVYIRRNAAGTFRNLVVANFGNAGIVIDGTGSQANLASGALVIDNALFFGNQCIQVASCQGAADPVLGNIVFRGGASSSYHQTGVAAAWAGKTIVEADPQFTAVDFGNPINGTAPDIRPRTGSLALAGENAATPTGSGVDASARFLGAFSAADNWIGGWTTWATQ
jgi:hypothetical protein